MAQESESKETMISLKTADGETFQVSPAIAKQMETVQNFIEDDSSVTSSVIPLPNVNGFELSKIIDYLDYHHRFRKGKGKVDSTAAGSAAAADDDEAKEFNAQFVKGLSHDQMKELLLAANYLNVKEFLEFMFLSVANLIENKSVEFVRDFFGIVTSYTPEEEEELRQKHSWAFEGVDED